MMKVIDQTMGPFQRPRKIPSTTKGKIRTNKRASVVNTTKLVKTAMTVIPRTTANPSRITIPSYENMGHRTDKRISSNQSTILNAGSIRHTYNTWA